MHSASSSQPARRRESPSESEDDEIEQQFQQTYDEVLSLKKLLQDLLNVSSGAADNADLEAYSPSSSQGSLDEAYDDGDDELIEHSGDPNTAFGLASDAMSPLQPIMRFSDEMCAFTPELLVESPARTPRRKHETSSSARVPPRNLRESRHQQSSSSNHEPAGAAAFPRASRSSLKLLRASATFEPNFQLRMRQFVAQNRQKKEQIRLSVCEKEDELFRPSPTINRRSKRIYRDVSHLMAWNCEKETRLTHLRQEESAKLSAQVAGKPVIARHSSELFDRREDDIAQCKVEDRLTLLGLIYQYQQEERLLAQTEAAAAGRFHPSVAPHSANLSRSSLSAHERLYQLGKQREKKKKAEAGNRQSSAPDNQTDNDARRQRRCRKGTESHEDGALPAAVQRLWAVGEAYKKKRAQLVERQNQQVDRLLNMPKLSSRSRQIAKQRSTKDAASLSDAQPHHHKRCACCRTSGDEGLADSSANAAKACRVDPVQASAIYEKQLRWKREKEAKDSQLKEFYDTLAASECTFRNPFYRDAWNTLSARSPQHCRGEDDDADDEHAASSCDANAAFFERSTRWAAQRERRLAREKEIWDELELRECTFQPKLSPRKTDSQRVSPRCTRSSWSPGKGAVASAGGSYPPSVCSSRYSRSRPTSPSNQQQRLYFPETTTFPRAYDALDLEELAATSSEPASSPGSSNGGINRRAGLPS